MHDIYYIVPAFLMSLLVASLLYKPIFRFACKHDVYDNPEARKLQHRPVPVMGGFVIFIATIVSLLCYWPIRDITPLLPVMTAMLLMLIVGARDDMHGLSPSLRFVIEVVVVVALALVCESPINDLHGLWGIHELSPWIAWPLTVVSCVGIINAINMIDGIDGLSSGMCAIALASLSWVAFVSHDFVHAAFGATLVGGIIPFLIMNVFSRKAKMFIGDAGTMMVGIGVCEMLMVLLTHDSLATKHFDVKDFNLIAFALAILSIPVFDTIRVMIGRISRGCSPFKPDKTHLHHAFIAYGFHHLEAALLEIILNMLIVFFWKMIEFSHLPVAWQLYGVLVAGFGVTYGVYGMLMRNTENQDEKVKQSETVQPMHR